MRGRHDPQATMLAFVDLEERVPQDHPIRTIKIIVDDALERLSPEFDPDVLEGGPSVRASGATTEGIAAHRSVLGAQ